MFKFNPVGLMKVRTSWIAQKEGEGILLPALLVWLTGLA
jgi:hypothetical protein